MEHDSTLDHEVDQLKKQVRMLSYVLGISVIIIALILTYTLPSVIQNNTFRVQWRVHHEEESAMDESADMNADMDSDMNTGMEMETSPVSDTQASSTATETTESTP